MSTSATPKAIDALFTNATAALSGTLVIDGYGVTDSANPNILMIGVDNPDNGQAANSSQATQSPGPMATLRPRDQSGSVTCAALSWSGGTNQKTVRDAAYTTLAAVENMLRTDPTQGVGLPGYSIFQVTDEALYQNQYEDGVDALVVFTVTYTARI